MITNIAIFFLTFLSILKPDNNLLEYKYHSFSKETGKELTNFYLKKNVYEISLDIVDFETDTLFKVNYSIEYNKKGLPIKYKMVTDEKKPKSISFFIKKGKLFLKNVDDKIKELKYPKKFYIFEPPTLSFLYPILRGDMGKIKLFIPSEEIFIDGVIKKVGFDKVKTPKGIKILKKYVLQYKYVAIEIYVDQNGYIAFLNGKTFGYKIILNSKNINSFNKDRLKDKPYLSKKDLKESVFNKTWSKLPITITTLSKKGNKFKKSILIIPDFGIPDRTGHDIYSDSKNNFYDDLSIFLAKKGFNVVRFSFEKFKKSDIKKLTFTKKQYLLKMILKNFCKRETILITMGVGGYIGVEFKSSLKKYISGLVLLNPPYFSYKHILNQQIKGDKNRVKSLRDILKKLFDTVNSNKKTVLFNGKEFSTDYFRYLFNHSLAEYEKYLKNNIAIFTSQYDMEISPDNGRYLYSKIVTNKGIKNVIYKNFSSLNHYFYKIPYRNYPFENGFNKGVDRDFLRKLYRTIRKY